MLRRRSWPTRTSRPSPWERGRRTRPIPTRWTPTTWTTRTPTTPTSRTRTTTPPTKAATPTPPTRPDRRGMTTSALERCVGDPRRFVEEHWGRAPLLHRGDPEGVAGLLDLGDVDHLVTETLLRMPVFRLVRDGEPLDPSTYTGTVRIGGRPLERTVRPDLVLSAFDRGATIVLQALHRQSGPVARFCRDLELALTHPVQANAYVTPPTSRGFDVHHDTHDVFVVQTHGRKSWRGYRPPGGLARAARPGGGGLGGPRGPPGA